MKSLLFVLSAYHRDIEQAVEMTRWMRELGSRFESKALLVTTKRTTQRPETAQVISNLQEVFQGGVTHYGLKVEDERGPWFSNNFMFRSVAQYVEHCLKDVSGFYFFEPDCTPTSPDWWEAIANEYEAYGKPFMGDVRGITYELNSPLHMNGSGIYPQNVAKYSVTALRADAQPWDSVARAEIVPNAHPTKLIATYFNTINYRERGDGQIVVRLGRNGVQDAGDDFLVSPVAKVIHGCKDGSLLNILRERRQGKKVIIKAPPEAPAGETLSKTLQDESQTRAAAKLKQRKSALVKTDMSAEEERNVQQLINTLELFGANDRRRARIRKLLEVSTVMAA